MATDLPPPLRGTDTGSFTEHTVTTRWPRIARRVIDENDYPDTVNDRIRSLVDEFPDATIRPIDDPEAPDIDLWNRWIDPYRGQSWLEIPWFAGETYFYRRIIEATGYFQAGPTEGDDPFMRQKQQGFAQSTDAIRQMCEGLAEDPDLADVKRALQTALWGNQADLSMWAAEEDGPDHFGTGDEEEHLLADDTGKALSDLDAPARIDIIADNAGFELIADLVLIDRLLASHVAETVVVHLKAHPTFVSDALIADVHATLGVLGDEATESVRTLAERCQEYQARGRLQWRDSFIWTSPLRFREFPELAMADLAAADLVITKGDANYRRLLGDRHWPPTTPFEKVVDYFPAPLLALRTCKAEVIAGLTQKQVDRLEARDPDWLVSGEWGVMQYAP